MKEIVQIKCEAKIIAGIKYDDDAKVYVSFSPGLGIYSQGTTKPQAKKALIDAIASFFDVAYANNILEKCIRLTGIICFSGRGRVKMKDLKSNRSKEYVIITEEKLLKRNNFQETFEVPTSLPFASACSL